MSLRAFSFLLFLSFFAGNAPAQNPSRACDSARRAAVQDAFQNQLKYYFYGIAGPDAKTLEKVKKLGVEAVSRGCMRFEEDDCYNQLADSIVFVRSGVRVSKLR